MASHSLLVGRISFSLLLCLALSLLVLPSYGYTEDMDLDAADGPDLSLPDDDQESQYEKDMAVTLDPENWKHLRIRRAIKSDIPYIRCHVCDPYLVQAVYQFSKRTQEQMSDPKYMEIEMIKVLESELCDPHLAPWITMLHMVEDETEGQIQVVIPGLEGKTIEEDAKKSLEENMFAHGEEGVCGVKCRTIAEACEVLVEGKVTELASAAYLEWTKLDKLGKSPEANESSLEAAQAEMRKSLKSKIKELLGCGTEETKCRKVPKKRLTQASHEDFVPLNDNQLKISALYQQLIRDNHVSDRIHDLINGQDPAAAEAAMHGSFKQGEEDDDEDDGIRKTHARVDRILVDDAYDEL